MVEGARRSGWGGGGGGGCGGWGVGLCIEERGENNKKQKQNNNNTENGFCHFWKKKFTSTHELHLYGTRTLKTKQKRKK